MFLKTFTLIYLLSMLNALNAKDNVILLHGLLRSSNSFSKLENELKRRNYHTINQDYPSRKYLIEELALSTIDKAISKCNTDGKIHFVTHSMGGILLRYYLKTKNIPNLGNVVMLAPPNKGSEVIDKLKRFWLFRFMNGPASLQLGTSKDSLPNSIGEANFNLGIIAGNKSFNLILSCLLPGVDDGKVTIENTKLEGMKDHIVMPTSHIFIMNNKKVWHQIFNFISKSEFDHPVTTLKQ